jgi:hypothetical protein
MRNVSPLLCVPALPLLAQPRSWKASYATSLKLNPNQKDVQEALKRVW